MKYIKTFTGKSFYPLDPSSKDIDIIDIAHSLSNKCRFAGHCREFYSVAQHCVHVADTLPKEFALWGLLHDAGEAYFADIPNPIKRQLPIFDGIEEPIMMAVAHKFDLSWPMPDEVKLADRQLLATEATVLLTELWDDFETTHRENVLSIKISPWSPQIAQARFLNKFNKLTVK